MQKCQKKIWGIECQRRHAKRMVGQTNCRRSHHSAKLFKQVWHDQFVSLLLMYGDKTQHTLNLWSAFHDICLRVSRHSSQCTSKLMSPIDRLLTNKCTAFSFPQPASASGSMCLTIISVPSFI